MLKEVKTYSRSLHIFRPGRQIIRNILAFGLKTISKCLKIFPKFSSARKNFFFSTINNSLLSSSVTVVVRTFSVMDKVNGIFNSARFTSDIHKLTLIAQYRFCSFVDTVVLDPMVNDQIACANPLQLYNPRWIPSPTTYNSGSKN